MSIKKLKLNILDVVVILAMILVSATVYIGYNNKPFLGDNLVTAKINILNATAEQTILPFVQSSNGKQIYYNSSKYPVVQKSYELLKDDLGADEGIKIIISAKGSIDYGRSIFNGQRIYANQKVELRGDYFAQGVVSDFYAD